MYTYLLFNNKLKTSMVDSIFDIVMFIFNIHVLLSNQHLVRASVRQVEDLG